MQRHFPAPAPICRRAQQPAGTREAPGDRERCSRQGWCFIQVGDDWELPPVPLLVWLLFHFVLAPTEHLFTCCTPGCVSAAVFSVVCSQGRNEGTPEHKVRSASFTTSKLSVLTRGREGSLPLPRHSPERHCHAKLIPQIDEIACVFEKVRHFHGLAGTRAAVR